MAGSVNKVILVGHLGGDPVVKSFQNGGRVANFSLATSERWLDKASGQKKERTEWHKISVPSPKDSGGLVDVCAKYLRKGSSVYIEGVLRTRKWTDQSGAEKYVTEVIVSGPGAVLQMLDKMGPDDAPGDRPAQGAQAGDRDPLPDDYVPF